MQFQFSPQSGPGRIVYHVDGDVLTVGGTPFDLSPLAEGDVLPAEAIAQPWFLGATRSGGEIIARVLLPYAGDASEAVRFPVPVTVTAGRVPLPTDEA